MTGIHFIHAPADRIKADQIRTALRKARLASGGWGTPADADAPRCYIVLWSKNSVGSDYVLLAAQHARDARSLLPVRVDDAQIPLAFSDLITPDLQEWNGDLSTPTFRQVVTQVVTLLATSATDRKRLVQSRREAEELSARPKPASPPKRVGMSDSTSPQPLASPPHRRKLFICYRRDDASDAAGRLRDHLAVQYSSEGVFMDIDSVPLGIDFVEHVTEQIGSAARSLS